MKSINPLELFLWTFRRNEKDVVNLYNTLSDVMHLVTGGDMLNFGYWDDSTPTPLDAQRKLCTVFGDFAQLNSSKKIIDVGSGYSAPAAQWQDQYGPFDLVSVNINYEQLRESKHHIPRVCATATVLPFESSSADRVVAFESAQHFRPLSLFLSESFRVLNDSGILTLAVPVISDGAPITKLGLLSMTWASEHYSQKYILDSVKNAGFNVTSVKKIGTKVYDPLATHYEKNRDAIRVEISKSYPGYVETILYKSIKKMSIVSQNKTIDYLLISCNK